MRIGIDARFYGPVGKGLGRYTERLIQNLERIDGPHEFVIFLRKENFDAYVPSNPRFRKTLADFRWYSLAEQVLFPPLIRKERIDLMHFPHFNVPVLTPVPFVVTIHDLILFRFPTRRASTLGPLSYGMKYAAYRLVIRLAVMRARAIVAVSEYTKKDILRTFKIPERKVVVTYEAADRVAPASPAAGHGSPAAPAKPYFLYVGNAYPHKNLEALIKVFAELRRTGLDAQLVLVGKSDYFYERLRTVAGDGVIFYGFAEEPELAALYRGARAYVFPSLLEGFGLPPLEAMRFGTPVAAADSSCLPEILADAAVYFDPTDLAGMAATLRRIFEDEALRHALAEKGRRRAEAFSWKDCAEKTYRTYLNALP